MILDIESLNENQRTAVDWREGPLLVLAGPGSGKTRVLTMRVAKLLLESPSKRFRILCLTFTNKAAAEMRSRVEEIVPDCRDRVLLTTFHSFCADVLRQHGSHLGIRPSFTILNQDADREAVLSDAIGVLKKKNANVDQNDVKLLPPINRLLSNCVSESEVSTIIKDKDFGKKLEALYIEYRRQLIINNRLDFPSLLNFTLQLFLDKPAIAKQVRTVYPHVCVDEFQDTNLAQYRVLKAIVGEATENLFVVADDDQIIYQWNGASPERLRALRDEFGMAVVQLPANYRCPPEVIVLANRMIKYNLDRAADKEPLYAIKESSANSIVRLEHFPSLDDELEWVAKNIYEHHLDETGDCVILARTRKILENAVTILENAGLEASLTIRKNEFTSAPFRWLHGLLRLANARGEREQLRRVCKAFYELEGLHIHVEQVVSDAPRYGGDFLRSWFESVQERDNLDANTLSFLHKGQKLIVDKMDVLNFVPKAFEWFSEQAGKIAGPYDEAFVDFEDELKAWNELQKRTVEKYGRDELSLNILLQEFDLSEKSFPVSLNAIRCLTIHGAKGMEFNHVYLVGLVEDQLPSFQSIKKGPKSREIQEERRNCFVAITRAQESLTMTYAQECFGWTKKPSRFLYEMELL